jgi:hypothetical protein
MIRKVSYESQERREKQVLAALNANGIKSLEEANQICEDAGVDPYQMCEDTQRICFENAKWAYVAGAAIAIKKGAKTAADAAEAIGIGLQAFCIPGSVADDRKVGLGHGNLAARLLREETQCFAFLAGHESFAVCAGSPSSEHRLISCLSPITNAEQLCLASQYFFFISFIKATASSSLLTGRTFAINRDFFSTISPSPPAYTVFISYGS